MSDVSDASPPRPIAIGAMRVVSGDVLDVALERGVTLIDTADVYGEEVDGVVDIGGNERLIAAAIARHRGASATAVTVVTKGGLRREGGRWVADGRASHVVEAAKATRERLRPGRGEGALDLHLLHAMDPEVPFATSVRALARLLEEGIAQRVGLSNVNRTHVEEALRICEITAVEVELGPHQVSALRGGLVTLCEERGIQVLAYRPLGGVVRAKKWGRQAVVKEIAERRGVTGEEVALAWVRGLGKRVVPLPGVTRVESVESVVRSAGLLLEGEEMERLGREWVSVGGRRGATTSTSTSTGMDVVVVMGMQGAGKSTIAKELVGYERFNRDERGGSLEKMAVLLDEALGSGVEKAVLDNTYASRASRAAVIEVAARYGAPVRCVWMDTSIEDAQVNAAARLIETYGRLPEPGELNRLVKKDPAAFRPTAQFNWRREMEPPSVDEGFVAVERREFRRVRWPFVGERRALIVELKVVEEVDVAAWRAAGWLVVGTAWGEAFVSTEMDVAVCPHPAGPPVCWCRKPLPGLGLLLTRKHGIDLARSWHVGRGAADRGFAERLGMRFADPDEVKGPPPLVG